MMSGRGKKYSQTENAERKVLETQRVVTRLKESQPVFEGLIRVIVRYTQEHQKVLLNDKTLVEALARFPDSVVGQDIQDSYRSVVACYKVLAEQKAEMVQAQARNILEGYLNSGTGTKQTRLQSDKIKVITFVKEYKDSRGNSLKNVKKAETKYAKSNKKRALKKTPEKAVEAAKELKEAIDKHNQFLGDELRSLAFTERKKHITLFKYFSATLKQQAEAYASSLAAIQKCQDAIEPLLNAGEEDRYLPEELRAIIKAGPCVVDKKTGGLNSSNSGNYIGKYDINGTDDDADDFNPKLKLDSSGSSSTAYTSTSTQAALADSGGLDYLSALTKSAGTLRGLQRLEEGQNDDSSDESDEDESSEESDDDTSSGDDRRMPGEQSVDELLRNLQNGDNFMTNLGSAISVRIN
eukprot:TRINITY_DN1513_c0_g1_i1.p1 TRINITY_DN1513_c0_g1~~TRINITY_DN1513_c0_g1_i1.p1  ORF type:complete len:409 (-),score=99.35 TRINITY_DN1513_c0_g1_i1:174-1400(-)